MAKSKTTWKWRSHEFHSKPELIAHLAARAREVVQGHPVYEERGADRGIRAVRIKVQVSLGPWPPPARRATAPVAGTAAAAGNTAGRKPPAPLKKVRGSKKDDQRYFGL